MWHPRRVTEVESGEIRVRRPLQIFLRALPGRLQSGGIPVRGLDGVVRRGGRRGGRGWPDGPRVSQGPRPAGPARHARGDSPRDSRPHPGLPVPAAARRARRGAAAELPRRAARRFAQHADCRCGRPAARVVREERVRRHRSRAAQGAVRALHRPHVPLLERGDAHDAGKRPDVRRIADAPRRGAVGRAPGTGRVCRSRAW